MANFFADNQDINYLFDYMDLGRTAEIMEEGFRFAKEFDYAPANVAEALENYRNFLDIVGEIAADVVAPTAEHTDEVGNTLNADGTVDYAPGIAEALRRLGQADMMGMTLPYRYGGLNCSCLAYTMANEIVTRADAALMNIFGLQGNGETLNAFADEEIKQYFLPKIASGEWTAAMVLTEPDAGSDLQSVKVSAEAQPDGTWKLNGVKRFITNGCGEVLLVLARSEAGTSDGRGLSLFVAERGPWVKIRRLEHKLGINGSPTCEMIFHDAPARLVGKRKRGLIEYVMSLMNGARVGIAAQGLGIGEAAYRVARDYAASRRQFGVAIDQFPAVRELLVDMSVDVRAARTLVYWTCLHVDEAYGVEKTLESDTATKEEKAAAKARQRELKAINGMLTPMSKYYASEMSMRVSMDSVAVLGGSGYMKDYAAERHLRDSRITTIYEGTSQLQVVAAIRGVVGSTAEQYMQGQVEALGADLPDWAAAWCDKLARGRELLAEASEYARSQPAELQYVDLHARRLVDMAIYLMIGYWLTMQAVRDEQRRPLAARWIGAKMFEVDKLHAVVTSGIADAMTEFETLAEPLIETA